MAVVQQIKKALLVLSLFFLLGCSAKGKTAVFAEPFIIATPTPQPTTEVIIASILAEGTLQPTLTLEIDNQPTKTPSPPTATPDTTADLRLGTAPELIACAQLSNDVAEILQDTFGLQVIMMPFKSNDALFENLASTLPGTADLTFCYRDPEDREALTQYFGFIEVLGGDYWTNGEERLQILIKTAVGIPLQNTNPCAYTYLRSLDLGTRSLEQPSFTTLLATNLDCAD